MSEATITKKQLDIMRHALGLGWAKESYRNYFVAATDNADCNHLVSLGLMERVNAAGIYDAYHVTDVTGIYDTFRVTDAGKGWVK